MHEVLREISMQAWEEIQNGGENSPTELSKPANGVNKNGEESDGGLNDEEAYLSELVEIDSRREPV